MGKIANENSEYYRNDDIGPLPEDLQRYLDQKYLNRLPNLEIAHPKLLVVFSGGNAVGKSALSKRLQDEVKALVLENDAIKMQLLNYDGDDLGTRETLGRITWNYTMNLYQRLDEVTPNGLVVRDGVIDWYFERILPIFEAQGYEVFVIRYDISREKSIELLQKRGGKEWISTEKLMELMDQHDYHGPRFLAQYTPDIILNDETVFDHDRVIAAVRAKLESLSNS